MHSQHDVMTRIAKRAEMLKEISGVVRPVKELKPEHTWREYRPVNVAASVPVALESSGVKKAELRLEIADTDAERRLGLGGRTGIPDNYGMLFTKAGAYWMKGVPFDLDIMFLDKTGSVLDMATMRALRPGEYPEIYRSKFAEADMAVEVPAGWCARNGIAPGDTLTMTNTRN